MEHPTRRAVLTTAAAAIATPAHRILGANDKINVAVIGIGGRGRSHVAEYTQLPESRVAAVCDVNQEAQERASAQVEKLQGTKPRVYGDMRKLFDDKEIDAVSMAIPNHWHALATIWACQAGKDVYIEKPACHNMWEGGKMIEAARKYKRMVQVGSQSRTIQHKIRAMQLLRDGIIGKVYMAKGLCYKRRKSIGHTPTTPVPPGINWDMFLGPAPMREFSMNRFRYNWHWFWDTGNGDIGNQGVHEMDIARWGLGKDTLPASVYSSGGKYAYIDDQETPNTQLATLDYGDCQLIFEVRGILFNEEGGIQRDGGTNVIGNLFFGSEGWMAVDLKGFQVYKGDKNEKILDEKYTEKNAWATGPHMQNFLHACRTRNVKDLSAEIEIGVASARLGQMANLSYRLGRKLIFDPAANQFVNDADANKMMTRDYRAPYVVPDKV
jgi:predicted dehydrogenase